MPAVARIVPRKSKLERDAARRSSGIRRKIPPSTSAAAIGFTNMTQRQPGPSVSRPPSSTPAADANAPIPPQTPRAVLRSRPSLNDVVRIESAAGSISAAPKPCTRRAPTSTPGLPAKPPGERGEPDQDRARDENAAPAEQVSGAPAKQHEAAVRE